MADSKISILLEVVDKGSGELKRFQDNLKNVESSVARFGAALGKMGAGVALAAAGGIAVLTKNALAAADEMGKAAAKIGLSVESLSALNYAAQLSDVSLEQLSNGFKQLNKSIVEAQDPTSKAATAFEALGVKVVDATGQLRSSDAVFADVATAFKELTDGAAKTAVAMEIFGKAGADLIPMLNSGAEGMAELRAEAEKLGLVISADTAKKAEEFNDTLTKMSTATTSLGMELASALLPTLQAIATAMLDARAEGSNFRQFAEGVGVVFKEVVKVASTLIGAFVAIGKGLGALGAAAASVANGEFKQAANIMSMWVDDTNKASEANTKWKASLDETTASTAANTEETKKNTSEVGKQIEARLLARDAEEKSRKEKERLAKASQDEAQREAKRREDYIQGLKEEAATLGMTTYQKQMYTAQTLAAGIANEQARAAFLQEAEAQAKRIEVGQAALDQKEAEKRAQEEQAKAIKDAMVSLQDEIALLELETSMVGKSTEERERAILVRELEKKGIDTTTEGLQDEINKLMELKKLKKDQAEVESVLAQTETGKLERQREKLKLMAKELEAGRITEQQWLESADVILGRSKEDADTVSEFWVNAAKNMQNAMSTFFFDIMQGKMSDMAGNFKKMIDKMVAEYLASQLASILFGDITTKGTKATGGGLVGGAMGWLGGLFKAEGGPVTGGNPYVVGEVGPELFVPKTSGTVIPADVTASLAGAGGGNTLNVTVTAMDSQDVIRSLDKIKRPLAEMLAGTNRTYNLGVR